MRMVAAAGLMLPTGTVKTSGRSWLHEEGAVAFADGLLVLLDSLVELFDFPGVDVMPGDDLKPQGRRRLRQREGVDGLDGARSRLTKVWSSVPETHAAEPA